MSIVFRSPEPDVVFGDVTVTEAAFAKAGELGEKPYLIDGTTGDVLTYAGAIDGIYRVAGGLIAAGLPANGVVAVIAANSPDYALAFHGTVTAGGTVTTLNPTYTVEEISHQLNDSGASMIICDAMFVETSAAAAAASGIDTIYTIGDVPGFTSFEALKTSDPIAAPVAVDPATHVAVLPYSSGTTGLSKGVELTHRNLVANLAQAQPVFGSVGDAVAVAVLPFFHIYGMQVLMNGIAMGGSTAVTMPRFDLVHFLEILQDYKVTHAYLVPPIILALAKHPLVDNYDLSALQRVVSGAAPLGADLAEEAARRIEADVVQGYGLTEVSPVSHGTFPGDYRPGSIGVLVPSTEARIVDPETGEDCGIDTDGELWLRGPQVMKGYLNNPQATADCIDSDGWFHTGDIARVDEHNHFYIVDRLKELIKYKGFQVPPAELEALLISHPDIADVAVVPVPDVGAGELPKAFVVRTPGSEMTDQEVKDFVAQRVATYKQVRLVEFIDEIPKSASGKILRRLLRDR
ncbi:Long-chain-fatty-acid--CoA ligase [hydrothermal vent metagenome]|uniref:Long-chain-fatty-acid--CoA ligase n=1 Tax=hydrothermal vent metagenome TaxID=652676 RepID=A0A3B0SBU4_9ZZZZ